MKNKIIRVLLFSVIVCLSTLFLPPNVGDEADYYITDVAVQEETTNLTAGITRTMSEFLCEVYDEVSIECIECYEPEDWQWGWITTNKTKVRDTPSVDSGILDIYYYNTRNFW